jgi:hypothetical protein
MRGVVVSGGRWRHHLSRPHALQEHPVLCRRREHVAMKQAAVVPERATGVLRRRLLLLPAEELVVERRRGMMVPVVEGHDAGGRREAVVGGEVDGRDARELLHHGAEVGRVRVEQRHGCAGPPPRRLAYPWPLDPGALVGRRLGRARPGGGDDAVMTVRCGGAVRAELRIVEPGPLRKARAGVTHRRHGWRIG